MGKVFFFLIEAVTAMDAALRCPWNPFDDKLKQICLGGKQNPKPIYPYRSSAVASDHVQRALGDLVLPEGKGRVHRREAVAPQSEDKRFNVVVVVSFVCLSVVVASQGIHIQLLF